MGNKDFSDWGGRKRKALVRPARRDLQEAAPRRRAGKKRENVGIKTKVDRLRALYVKLRWWLERRGPVETVHRGGRPGKRYWMEHGVIRDYIKDIRRLQADYKREGVLEAVKKAL